MASFIWTIIGLGIIYIGIGFLVELINAKGEDDDFELNAKTMKRILKWPKNVFGRKSS